MIESLYEKELLLSKLCTSYYLERDSHIRDKVKVELDLNATKKELYHPTGVDISDSAAKKNFVALKAEVDKLDINQFVNFQTSLNNINTKVHDLEVGKLKTFPVCRLEKIKLYCG